MTSPVPRWRPPTMRRAATKEVAHYRTADWQAKRQRIAIRDSYVCRDCGRVAYGKTGHADHIVSLEDGGRDDDENLAWRCSSCHGKKTRAEQRRRGVL